MRYLHRSWHNLLCDGMMDCVGISSNLLCDGFLDRFLIIFCGLLIILVNTINYTLSLNNTKTLKALSTIPKIVLNTIHHSITNVSRLCDTLAYVHLEEPLMIQWLLVKHTGVINLCCSLSGSSSVQGTFFG